jgi:hypothetical protein
MKRTLLFLSCLTSALLDFLFARKRTRADLAESNLSTLKNK